MKKTFIAILKNELESVYTVFGYFVEYFYFIRDSKGEHSKERLDGFITVMSDAQTAMSGLENEGS